MSSLDITAFLQRFDAVCYDMDGTLIDSESCFEQAWIVLLTKRNIDTSRFNYDDLRGFGGDLQVQEVIRQFGLGDTVAELLSEWVGIARPIVKKNLRMCDGALASLRFCEQVGIPKALVTTSSGEYTKEVLTHLDLINRFEFLVTRTTMENLGTASKPAPYPYLLACWRLGTDPSRTLVVEDSVVGATAAKAAGCQVIGLSHGSEKTSLALREVGVKLVYRTLAQVRIIDFNLLRNRWELFYKKIPPRVLW